jgi:DNA-binding SARP family transcriptional activator
MSAALLPGGHFQGIVQLCVVGGFALTVGPHSVTAPLAVQRLLAFLALHARPVTRSYVAGSLWAEVTEQRAVANLRATLWRTPATGVELITCTRTQLALGPAVAVDLADIAERARRLIECWSHPPISTQDGRSQRPDVGFSAGGRPEEAFISDLLPGWDDEWVAVERERLRQLRLHALDALARSHLYSGDTARAIDVALQAVAAEPRRESAWRLLIEAHLAEGNVCEAVRECERFRELLYSAVGLRPSRMLESLIDRHRAGAAYQASDPHLARVAVAAGAEVHDPAGNLAQVIHGP